MIHAKDALEYHTVDRPGKLEVRASKACLSPREIRLAYLPGAAFPAAEIARDPAASYRYTARGNLVAVVTNGTAVPGLGRVGAAAAKPFQEGIAMLFKRLADIDVFDLELDTSDPDRFVDAVKVLEPTFGAVNLKDIAAPDGLLIYDRLRDGLAIPVFHETLYGTAVVAMAALINALDLTSRRVEDPRVVVCGAGTVGLGCARLLRALGVPAENLLLYDIHGLIHPERDDLNPYQRAFARDDTARTLAQGLKGADVFLGAAGGGVLQPDMIRSMGRFPIVFAMGTPEPEVGYEEARRLRRDILVATSQAAIDPNAIVDLLSFPYILRGALDVHASRITEGMMLAAARALAELAREEVVEEVSRAYGSMPSTFGPEYFLPRPIDPRVLVRESSAVARVAIEEGVAARPIEKGAHEEALTVRLGSGREILRQIILKARQVSPRIIFPDGAEEITLRACAILLDEGIGSPILLGKEEEILRAAERLGMELGGVATVDPGRDPRFEGYADEYFRMRARRGITPDLARRRLSQPSYFGALMLHRGDADMMILGVTAPYADSLRTVLEVIGPAPGVRRISSIHMVLRPKKVYFVADCAVNIEPDAETLAEIALLSARLVRSLSIEPRIAMLSFSNFGSVEHPFSRKVRAATLLARERAPHLPIEGEIQLASALDEAMRRQFFPFSELREDANVLICPDLQSGGTAIQLIKTLGETVAVGPILLGTRRPVHLLQYGFSVQDVVNLAAVGAVKAAFDAGAASD
jgi:malate dehydrogenase (oxaloacetate-decarboxylating)(NADP+)